MDKTDKTCVTVYSSEAQLTQEQLLEQFEQFEKANNNTPTNEEASGGNAFKTAMEQSVSRGNISPTGNDSKYPRTVWKIEHDGSKTRRNSDNKQLSPKKNSKDTNGGTNIDFDSGVRNGAQQSISFTNKSVTKYTKPVSDMLITGMDDNLEDREDSVLVDCHDNDSNGDKMSKPGNDFLEDEDGLSVSNKEESKSSLAGTDWMNVAVEDNICGFETNIDSVLSLDVTKDIDIPLPINSNDVQELESINKGKGKVDIAKCTGGENWQRSQTCSEGRDAKQNEMDNEEDSSENEIVEISINYDSSGSPTITKYGKGQVSLDSSGSYEEMEMNDLQGSGTKKSGTKIESQTITRNAKSAFTDNYIQEQIQEANKAIDNFLICKDRFQETPKSIDGGMTADTDTGRGKGNKRSGNEMDDCERKRTKRITHSSGDIYASSFPHSMRVHDLAPPVAIVSPLGYPDAKFAESQVSKPVDVKYPNALEELLANKDDKHGVGLLEKLKPNSLGELHMSSNIKDTFQTLDGSNWSFDGVSADKYLFDAGDMLKNVTMPPFNRLDAANDMDSKQANAAAVESGLTLSTIAKTSINKEITTDSLSRRSVLEQLLGAHGIDNFKTKQSALDTVEKGKEKCGSTGFVPEKNTQSISGQQQQASSSQKDSLSLASARKNSIVKASMIHQRVHGKECDKTTVGLNDQALAEQTKAKYVMHHRSSTDSDNGKQAIHPGSNVANSHMKNLLQRRSSADSFNSASHGSKLTGGINHTHIASHENRTTAGTIPQNLSASQEFATFPPHILQTSEPNTVYGNNNIASSTRSVPPPLLPVAVARNMSLESLAKYISDNPAPENLKSMQRQMLLDRINSLRAPAPAVGLQGNSMQASQPRPQWPSTHAQMTPHSTNPQRLGLPPNIHHPHARKLSWPQPTYRMPNNPVPQTYIGRLPSSNQNQDLSALLRNPMGSTMFQRGNMPGAFRHMPTSTFMNASAANGYDSSKAMAMSPQTMFDMSNDMTQRHQNETLRQHNPPHGILEESIASTLTFGDLFPSSTPNLSHGVHQGINNLSSPRDTLPNLVRPTQQIGLLMMNPSAQRQFHPNSSHLSNENYIMHQSHQIPSPRYPAQQQSRFQFNQQLAQTNDGSSLSLHSTRMDMPLQPSHLVKSASALENPVRDARYFQARDSQYPGDATVFGNSGANSGPSESVAPAYSQSIGDISRNSALSSQPFQMPVGNSDFGNTNVDLPSAEDSSEVAYAPPVSESAGSGALLDMPYIL